MAKEILDAVRNAEEECEKIILEAESKAKELIENAEKQAQELISSSDAAARNKADSFLTSVKEENEEAVRTAEELSVKECGKLHETAEKNRQSVIICAVEKFF